MSILFITYKWSVLNYLYIKPYNLYITVFRLFQLKLNRYLIKCNYALMFENIWKTVELIYAENMSTFNLFCTKCV